MSSGQKCPKCGLINPGTAQTCDCGYCFEACVGVGRSTSGESGQTARSTETRVVDGVAHVVEELAEFVGVKEDAPASEMLDLLNAGKVKECIEKVAWSLGLPVSVNLTLVPATYRPNSEGRRFDSTALAKTDASGRGVEGIVGQVSIPGHLPSYGSRELRGFQLDVRVSENCRQYPVTFLTIMSHELSHVLLHALWYTRKDSELHTDVAAMVLGFSKVMQRGRKTEETTHHLSSTETRTTTYGYLSEQQFDVANRRVGALLRANRRRKTVLNATCRSLGRELGTYEACFLRIQTLLKHLDADPRKRIGTEDAFKLVLLHRPGYSDDVARTLGNARARLREVDDFCRALVHYTKPAITRLRQLAAETDALATDLGQRLATMEADLEVVEKYSSFLQRLRARSRTRRDQRRPPSSAAC